MDRAFMAIERAVLPEQVRVNILSSEGARSTVRCSHKRIVPSAAWNLSITSEVATGLPGKSSEMREKAGEAVAKLADVTQQAGSQAKQTASSLAADANQKAKGFCRQASSRQLNVRRASARTSMPNTMPESPHIPDLRRGSGTACV
jgi:hypothetical protein